jgi:isoamylase
MSSRRWYLSFTVKASRSFSTWCITIRQKAMNSAPLSSFKGIDNASYYRLARHTAITSMTRVRDTVNLSHQRVLQLVADSLRYWAQEMHVDGFRFDLATILAREPTGFDEGGGFLDACRQDPILSQIKLVAEPWDCGPGGYQVGHFSPGWAEWNDRFRDTVRAFWKGDEGKLADFATRLSASPDLFNKRGRKPWASVNFITAHDGFTLNDLVSYNDKHNEANGEDNRDGHSHNLSWNHGVEGPTDDPAIKTLRFKQMRNMLATLLFSRGTPMILAGDEIARSQQGNNNAYAQDNEISWINWQAVDEAGWDLFEFTRALIDIRQKQPLFHRGRFLTGAYNEELGVKDVTWLDPSAAEMSVEQWNDSQARSFAMLIDGRAQPTGIRRKGLDRTLLLMINAHHEAVQFAMPSVPGGESWRLLMDTDRALDPPRPRSQSGSKAQAAARSLLLWELRPPEPNESNGS